MDIVEIVGTALIVLGTLAFVAAAIGVLKLPDLYSRISAITTASGLGLALIILGVVLHEPSAMNAVKATLAIVINLATAAVGGHALGRAGYLTGAPLTKLTQYDELQETIARHQEAED
ncbi:monovalent cation/H(+) antiporter subunit G [Hoyosella rhizosphaerae]|uniref:Na+/H+ antiporter subunit G n=1 Tax=Hoyosella rhizosphaerae TaxID=1755582 RepID=A0A916UJR5_9ACTN|nr:monovalent cation/H(+) antiporter subunit G [Hoyosella rhizosphaerae]MBN4925397.1 monovalent cation/H(+) antiporter subunit G [Hoyosella rhizosphaerae]GGC75510.1 Na+/H+ antiporter subunit G [Hoyosella rhizosphaerae]